MNLVSVTTNQTLVEFHDHKPIFHNKYLEKEMKEIGIVIPDFLRGDFQGRAVIKLDDDLFNRAFKDVFYPLHMDSSKYQWR